MTAGRTLGCATVLLATFAGTAPAPCVEADRTWRWFVDCPQPHSTRLQVTLRGRTLYDATLPLCDVTPSERSQRAEQRRLRFFFTTDAGLFGDEFRHLGVRRIEGNVWEAGGDADQIILGLSFQIPEQILLNTLHLAAESQRSTSDLARGLTSSTSPFLAARK